MLELYVDRLIDLLAPAGKEVSFKVLSILSNDWAPFGLAQDFRSGLS